jgi:hypothetical protein
VKDISGSQALENRPPAGGLNNDLCEKNVTIFGIIGGERTKAVFGIDEIRSEKAADGGVIVVDDIAGKVALNTALKVIRAAASPGGGGSKPRSHSWNIKLKNEGYF